jgi:hypothetical protein
MVILRNVFWLDTTHSLAGASAPTTGGRTVGGPTVGGAPVKEPTREMLMVNETVRFGPIFMVDVAS